MNTDDLTPDFFSRILETEVSAVRCERVGTGMVGLNVRCSLDYRDAGTGPRSLVVKLPSDDPTSRATGVAMRNYEREVRFYSDLADTVDVRSPRCFHAALASDDSFVLVLEDINWGEQGNQITGCNEGEASAALRELAALHAPRWADPTLDDIEWLGRRTVDTVAQLQGLYALFVSPFLDRYGSSLDAAQTQVVHDLGQALPRYIDAFDGPYTLTHGDFRLDNMLFSTSPGHDPVVVVDWQTPGHGSPGNDLAYFLGACMPAAGRRRHEDALIAGYHAELVARGVTGWSLAECQHVERIGSLAGVIMSVVASQIVERTERGDEMFVAMATRHTSHALDRRALDAL